jgi:hypothetical protein
MKEKKYVVNMRTATSKIAQEERKSAVRYDCNLPL